MKVDVEFGKSDSIHHGIPICSAWDIQVYDPANLRFSSTNLGRTVATPIWEGQRS